MATVIRPKQIMFYGVGVPHGERPQSLGATQIIQEAPAEVHFAGGFGKVTGGFSQPDPALVHYKAGSGAVAGSPTTIVGNTAVVHYQAGVGSIVSGSGFATQTGPAVVYYLAGGTGSGGRPGEIVQHTPAEFHAQGVLGSASHLLAQHRPAVVEFHAGPGKITLQGFAVQDKPAEVHYRSNSAATDVPTAQTQEAVVHYQAGSGAVVFEQGIVQNEPGHVHFVAGAGTVSFEREAIQCCPGFIHYQAGQGSIELAPSQPKEIEQTAPAVVHYLAAGASSYLGEDAVESWTGPHECLQPFVVAHEIVYKKPADVFWVSYEFDFDPQFTILSAVIDDDGAGVISSLPVIGGVNGEPNIIRYEVSNGQDDQNVRISHTIELDDPDEQFRYGDGFLYVREVF